MYTDVDTRNIIQCDIVIFSTYLSYIHIHCNDVGFIGTVLSAIINFMCSVCSV